MDCSAEERRDKGKDVGKMGGDIVKPYAQPDSGRVRADYDCQAMPDIYDLRNIYDLSIYMPTVTLGDVEDHLGINNGMESKEKK